MFKYITRKLVYIVVGPGLVAASAYLTGHQDYAEWTLHGITVAVEAAIAGALLSENLGGALSKK